MTEDFLKFLISHPLAFILVGLYLTGMIGATYIRAKYPDTEKRPPLAVTLLVLFDFLQLNISGPAKLFTVNYKIAKQETVGAGGGPSKIP